MTFNKGDKLTIYADYERYDYIVSHEETVYGTERLHCIDEDGDAVLLTKATVVNRIGISWEYRPVSKLPEDLFKI